MSKVCGMKWSMPVAAAALLAFTACSNDGKVAGGTEAESTIALQVQLADGSPAGHSRVRMLPNDFLSDGASGAAWMESDETGFVEIVAEPGKYALEVRNVRDSRASGAVMNLTLDTNVARSETVKLGELSTIEGFVFLGEESPVIRVMGLDRYVVPDSTGHFVIDSLPVGAFDVHVTDAAEKNSATLSFVPGDTLYVDCSDPESEIKVFKNREPVASKYPEKDWSEHDALLAQMEGYAVGTLGAAGVTDTLGNISRAEGEICIVTTTEDYLIVEDTTEVDSAGNAKTSAVIAPGSLRDCAYREGPTWILFEKSGTYNLQSPLRLKNDKTFDGRGRDVRFAGMGILTETSSNLIFENITFTAPAITVLDTSSRRALSIHNRSHHVWVDHCTFEEYPLVELDVKRGSHNVTVSWNRFENAQTGILFGLEPDIFVDSLQTFTLHHNYFAGLEARGVVARHGKMHAYGNFFYDVELAGIECSDSASCYIESNVFNNGTPVADYRLVTEDGAPDMATKGFPYMLDNWFASGGDDVSEKTPRFKPDYKVVVDQADTELAVRVKNEAGPR